MMKELVFIAVGLLILTEISMALLTGGAEDCFLAAGPTGEVESAGIEHEGAGGLAGLLEGAKR